MLVSWFSAGVSSAVATKLIVGEIDRIIYIHIDDQHSDTSRFATDCERWFGKSVERLQHPYKSVENACLMAGGTGYLNGPGGAACSIRLKKRVRKEWEQQQTEPLTYVWGFDVNETARRDRLCEAMPEFEHRFPLIDERITKAEAHKMLAASGIKRPAMYDLGYQNNNCIGCVKGGAAYWNRIRRDFPEVFDARARLERRIGASCINGTFLDELDPMQGRDKPPICDDCGIMCEIMAVI